MEPIPDEVEGGIIVRDSAGKPTGKTTSFITLSEASLPSARRVH